MRASNFDLVAVASAAVLAVVFVLQAPSGAARAMFALPLVLFLPGYALAAAAFRQQDVWSGERIVLTLGLSLATVTLGGLMLNATPFGLRTESWGLLLVGTTLAACAVALGRRLRQPAAQRVPGILPSALQAATLCLAALLAVGAVQVARVGAANRPTAGFTQLWIAPVDETGQRAVRVGVNSHDAVARAYRLQLEGGGQTLLAWPEIQLAPGERWQTTVAPRDLPRSDGPLVAVLRPTDSPDESGWRVALWR